MKKRNLLLSTFFLTLICSSYSQVSTSIGFKGGVNINRFTGSNVSNANAATGPYGGGFIGVGLAEVVQLQFETIYSTLGGEFAYDGDTYETSLTYLEFPLMFKLRIPVGDHLMPYGFIGQSAGFKIAEDTKMQQKETEEGGVLVSNKDIFKGVNLSTIFGIGLDVKTNQLIFNLDMRYSLGTIDMASTDLNAKNSGLIFTAGIGFLLSNQNNGDIQQINNF